MQKSQCSSAFLSEEAESTLLANLHMGGELTLDGLRKQLCAKRRALPNNVRHLRAHQHFGLSLDSLQMLEEAFPKFETDTLVSCFFDTEDFCLARTNRWLTIQGGVRTLKSCEALTDETFVIFHSEQDPVKIEEQVAQMLDTNRAPIIQLCPHRFAIIRTTRRTYDVSSPGCSIYVDVAELSRKDFYLVGTMSLAAEKDALVSSEWPQMGLHSIFSPVPSRVVESLYVNNRSTYDVQGSCPLATSTPAVG
jgi:hypothetical protein